MPPEDGRRFLAAGAGRCRRARGRCPRCRCAGPPCPARRGRCTSSRSWASRPTRGRWRSRPRRGRAAARRRSSISGRGDEPRREHGQMESAASAQRRVGASATARLMPRPYYPDDGGGGVRQDEGASRHVDHARRLARLLPRPGAVRRSRRRRASRFTDLTIPTEDGERLHGWWIPTRAAPARGHVLFFHGNAGNVSHRLEHARRSPPPAWTSSSSTTAATAAAAGRPSEEGLPRDARASPRRADRGRAGGPGAPRLHGGVAGRRGRAAPRPGGAAPGLRAAVRRSRACATWRASTTRPRCPRWPGTPIPAWNGSAASRARPDPARRRGRDRALGARARPVRGRARAAAACASCPERDTTTWCRPWARPTGRRWRAGCA